MRIPRTRWRGMLFAGTSLVALAAAAAPQAALANGSPSAAAMLSPSSLAAASRSLSHGTAGPLSNPAIQAQIALSTANLARASLALQSMAARQAAAAASAASALTNPTGVPFSGLQCSPQCDAPVDTTQWINAAPFVKPTSGNTATVHQTAQNAVLTWTSFNLYTGETLVFDQQGQSNWSVLNRVNSPGTAPTQIFGTIKAPGNVYVIDRNGIIFGGTSQINVHSLVASSLDVGAPGMSEDERNQVFMNGIANAAGPSFSWNQNDTTVEGNITVEAGAQITATPDNTNTGGFVYMFAPNVSNAGTISAPLGEAMLVATQTVTLTPNYYPDGGITAANNTFLATGYDSTEVKGTSDPDTTATDLVSNHLNPWVTVADTGPLITAPGSVVNTGLIQSDRGTIILNGDNVVQGGVVQANTSVSHTGYIFLDARLQLTLAPGSSTQILPYEDGSTIPLSTVSSFKPGQIEMHGNSVAILGPGTDSSGASAAGALVEAPGGDVAVTALASPTGAYLFTNGASLYPFAAPALPQRAYIADGATIDVSGLDGVTVPVSSNFVTVKPNGNEFADQPLQRDSNLLNQPLTFDIRNSGTTDGIAWVGTPLADVSGYVGDVPQSLDVLLTTGGMVNLAGASYSSMANKVGGSQKEVIAQRGSTINVAGGYVQYTGGMVHPTYLIDIYGQVVSLANASPLDTYLGVAGLVSVTHPHWGANTSQTFVNPLLYGGYYEPGYVEGHDAGGVSVTATTPVIDGTIVGGVIVGERQAALGLLPSLASTNAGDLRQVQFWDADSGTSQGDLRTFSPSTASEYNSTVMPSAGYLTINAGKTNNFVIEEDPAPQLPSNFSPSSPALPSGSTIVLSADALSHANFGSAYDNLGQISIPGAGSILVSQGADLSVHPGGIISFAANAGIEIDGTLTARAGTISAQETSNSTTAHNIVVGSQAVLDASGMWVNDAGANRESLVGGAYINGGSITLQTSFDTGGQGQDTTGSIILSSTKAADGTVQNALLDVSSGGWIMPNGGFKLNSSGAPAGNGGNLTLDTYVGSGYATGQNQSQPIAPGTPPSATIEIETTDYTTPNSQGSPTVTFSGTLNYNFISAYGLAQGGSFTAQAPSIQIGGAQPAGSQNGNFYLPTSFFTGGPFTSYSLTAISGGLSVEADSPQGSTLVLRQQNFVADPALKGLPTGAKLAQIAALAYQPDAVRTPVNLQLNAEAPINSYTLPPPQSDVQATYPTLNHQPDLLIDSGVAILGDPGATIGVNIAGRPNTIGYTANGQVNTSVQSQTGLALILGDIIAPGGTIAITDAPGVSGRGAAQVWLGPRSVLSAAGTSIIDTRQTLFRSGKVLPGGTVSIVLSQTGSSIVAQPGAVINVSGASDTVDILGPAPASSILGAQYQPTPVWSDAGSIALSAYTVLYGGSYLAQPGASQGNGGTLAIGGPTIVVQPSDTTAYPSLIPGGDLSLTAYFKNAYLSQSQIDPTRTGVANLTLSSWAATTGPTSLSLADGDNVQDTVYSPGTVTFSGDVTLNVPGNLLIDAATLSINGSNTPVNLFANYFALRGVVSSTANPSAGTGNTLNVTANSIDLAGGVLSNVSQANFDITPGISGDIRLRVPLVTTVLNATPGQVFASELLTAGNLTLSASQVYPVTDVDFTLKSTGSGANITITRNGAAPSAAPLSAGGSVSIDAATIVQSGTLLAPLGTIRLGANTSADLSPNDPTSKFTATASLTFGSDSVTSVSLGAETVPYGETQDGQDWTYDSEGSSGAPQITAPPSKSITLSGKSITIGSNATINLTGGGDIQAMEFVPGTGGTRDVLSTANYPNVYAIVPGYNPSAAPIDYDFLDTLGDKEPLVGQRVYLSGIAGLAPGYYTLLPSHYATLPGGYRVELVSNTQDALASNNVVLPDGTMQVAGYFANTALGTRNSRAALFDVQSSAVWRQYSEIDQASGNAYFSAQAASSGTAAPSLPMDGGRLVFNLSSGASLNIASQLATQPANGGRGVEVDVNAQNIFVYGSSSQAVPSGYVGIAATALTTLGADSLLLGGTRSDGSSGEVITSSANNVEIANSAATPLSAGQVMLVATQTTSGRTATSGTVQLDDGSVIAAQGPVASGDSTSYAIGGTTTDGAILAVTNGPQVNVQRGTPASNTGTVKLLGKASVSGSAFTMDATGGIQVSDNAGLNVRKILAVSQSITLGATSNQGAGFNITSSVLAQLTQAQVQMLTLRSAYAAAPQISFASPITLAMSNPVGQLVLDTPMLVAPSSGTAKLTAGEVDFANSGAASSAAAVSGSAALQVDAATIGFGSGTVLLNQFGSAGFTGTQQIVTTGTGTLTAGAANLTFTTPLFLVGGGSNETVNTSGRVAFAGGVGTPTGEDELGGTLSVKAGSINVNSLIQAISGDVQLEATSNDVTLGSSAYILANGYAQTFFDVTRIAPGGTVELTSDNGNLVALAGARIDVSSPQGYPGYAGHISLTAESTTPGEGNLAFNPFGGLAFDPSIIAGSVPGDGGGQLFINVNSIAGNILPSQFAALSVPALFSDTVNIHTAEGSLSVGPTLTAQNVTLTADAGTINVSGTIDASGAAGGSIGLYGGQGVTLTPTAALLAYATGAGQRGGNVTIGTEVAAENGSAANGTIDLVGGTIDVSGGPNGGADGTVRLRAPYFINAQNQQDVAIDAVGSTITGAGSVTVEAFNAYAASNSNSPNDFNGTINPASDPGFFGSCSIGASGPSCTGTLMTFIQGFTLAGAGSEGKFASLSQNVLQLQPGVELVNNDPTINNGDIIVSGNWNLGAGVAGYLTDASGNIVTDQWGNLLPADKTYKGALYFAPGVSQITELYYRTSAGEAPAVTLRAIGNVNIGASISDGFFLTQNRLDSTYASQFNDPSNPISGGTIDYRNDGGLVLNGMGSYTIAPYVSRATTNATNVNAANAISATAQSLAAMDLFPNDGTPINSSSFNIAAGADTNSANPLAVKPLSSFSATSHTGSGEGDVVISGHTQASGIQIPTMVRTGNGSISIAAGRDFVLQDHTAPGVVYTAGVQSPNLPGDPNFQLVNGAYVATNPAGFLVPQILSCLSSNACFSYGAITAAAYPVDGGDLTVTAQRDITGFEDTAAPQYYAPWLISQSTALADTAFGAFAPQSALLTDDAILPSQTSWWINFGSFDQGLMSVGGNIRVSAGRNIDQLSVSAPTTAWVSGGLSPTTPTVLTINPSGNMTVTAGSNISSGAFYEGSGKATITAGGSVQADPTWTKTDNVYPASGTGNLNTYTVSTVLAVDTGSIALTARSGIDIAGIVSGASMRDVADTSTAVNSNNRSNAPSFFLSSYGPDSAVTLESIAGSVVTNSLTDPYVLILNQISSSTPNHLEIQDFAGVSLYPASFEASSLLGNIMVADAFQLSPSNTGTLTFLAQNSLYTFQNYSPDTTDGRGNSVAAGDIINLTSAMSTGPSLVEQVFDPMNPVGLCPTLSCTMTVDKGPLLLHQGDPTLDRFYAVAGDIVSGSGSGAVPGSPVGATGTPLAWEIDKPSITQAGQDIVDVPFFGQNLSATDVTQVIAGRDIYYTGAWQLVGQSSNTVPGGQNLTNFQASNSNPNSHRPDDSGLNLAGPGFFDVQAGRNLGPFVTPQIEQALTGVHGYENDTDTTGIGIITWGNTVTVGNRLMKSDELYQTNSTTNTSAPAADSFALVPNSYLSPEGASIIANAGISSPPDYQGMINTYINPAVSGGSYMPQLQTFMQQLGYGALSPDAAWNAFVQLSPTFQSPLQHVFADQVLFSELLNAGSSKQYSEGYNAIAQLFPAAAAGGTPIVYNGTINLIHATIKTEQGGAISILNPGRGIDVGTTATEPTTSRFTAGALGILSLDGGGINTFTNGSVLVDQSRILTVEGGDILMWSSNGDLDAGRGQKTTVDYEPFSAYFDPWLNEIPNLTGLVTGAGIGSIKGTPDAPSSTVSLYAPRGTINFGAAGVRSSGNLNVGALTVINAANASVAGVTTGVPTAVSFNLGAWQSAAAAGGTNQVAQAAAAAAANRSQQAPQALPSIITVRVLGYGDCDPKSPDCQ